MKMSSAARANAEKSSCATASTYRTLDGTNQILTCIHTTTRVKVTQTYVDITMVTESNGNSRRVDGTNKTAISIWWDERRMMSLKQSATQDDHFKRTWEFLTTTTERNNNVLSYNTVSTNKSLTWVIYPTTQHSNNAVRKITLPLTSNNPET